MDDEESKGRPPPLNKMSHSQVPFLDMNQLYNWDSPRHGFDPWVRKIPWRRKWYPSPVFLPRKSHGQRSLAGYSPCGRRESDMTEQLTKPHTEQQNRMFLQ